MAHSTAEISIIVILSFIVALVMVITLVKVCIRFSVCQCCDSDTDSLVESLDPDDEEDFEEDEVMQPSDEENEDLESGVVNSSDTAIVSHVDIQTQIFDEENTHDDEINTGVLQGNNIQHGGKANTVGWTKKTTDNCNYTNGDITHTTMIHPNTTNSVDISFKHCQNLIKDNNSSSNYKQCNPISPASIDTNTCSYKCEGQNVNIHTNTMEPNLANPINCSPQYISVNANLQNSNVKALSNVIDYSNRTVVQGLDKNDSSISCSTATASLSYHDNRDQHNSDSSSGYHLCFHGNQKQNDNVYFHGNQQQQQQFQQENQKERSCFRNTDNNTHCSPATPSLPLTVKTTTSGALLNNTEGSQNNTTIDSQARALNTQVPANTRDNINSRVPSNGRDIINNRGFRQNERSRDPTLPTNVALEEDFLDVNNRLCDGDNAKEFLL